MTKLIRISEDVDGRLRQLGRFGESYDEGLRRLLNVQKPDKVRR
jgi:predicted CopG family antitoxin